MHTSLLSETMQQAGVGVEEAQTHFAESHVCEMCANMYGSPLKPRDRREMQSFVAF